LVEVSGGRGEVEKGREGGKEREAGTHRLELELNIEGALENMLPLEYIVVVWRKARSHRTRRGDKRKTAAADAGGKLGEIVDGEERKEGGRFWSKRRGRFFSCCEGRKSGLQDWAHWTSTIR